MKCKSCYPMSEIAIKLINTKKYYEGVYKKKCAQCGLYYIKKGGKKNGNIS